MSLACIYGGHECDGCLCCEDEKEYVREYDEDYEHDSYVDECMERMCE